MNYFLMLGDKQGRFVGENEQPPRNTASVRNVDLVSCIQQSNPVV